jgi:hypothetical protein
MTGLFESSAAWMQLAAPAGTVKKMACNITSSVQQHQLDG